MSNLTPELVVNVNRDRMAINCFCNFLWEQKPFRETMKKSAEVNARYNGIPYTLTINTTIKSIRDSLENRKTLQRLFDRDRKKIVSPFYRNTAEYIRGDLETDLSLDELYNVLKAEFTAENLTVHLTA